MMRKPGARVAIALVSLWGSFPVTDHQIKVRQTVAFVVASIPDCNGGCIPAFQQPHIPLVCYCIVEHCGVTPPSLLYCSAGPKPAAPIVISSDAPSFKSKRTTLPRSWPNALHLRWKGLGNDGGVHPCIWLPLSVPAMLASIALDLHSSSLFP